jgi:Ca2+-binding RTX toxin-like protein
VDSDGVSQTASYTVGLVDRFGNPEATGVDMRLPTLSEIATLVAAAINDQAQPDFTAVAEGHQVFIVNRAGTAFTATYDIAPAGSLVEATPALTSSQVSVGSNVRAGDEYEITITVGAEDFSVSYTAESGNSATDVASALAALLNSSTDPDAASFSALSQDADLFIVNRDGSVFTPAYSFVQASGATLGATVAKPLTLDASGSTAVAGEIWELELTAGSTVTTYEYTTTSNDLQMLLEGLATTVNANPASSYSADTTTDALQLFRFGNISFTADLKVLGGYVAEVDASTASTATIQMVGNLVVGETWELALSDQIYTLTVTSVMTSLDEVAAGLASLVNADDTHAAAYTAIGEGDTLILVNRNGDAYEASVSVTPVTPRTVSTDLSMVRVDLVGYPLTDEVWSVTLGGHAYNVTVDATTNTLDEIAAALASEIRSDSTFDNFTADSEGDGLLIFDLEGKSFTPQTSIKPVSGYKINTIEVIDPDSGDPVDEIVLPVAFMDELDSTPTTGQAWRITLNGPDNTSQLFSVTVGDTYFGSIVADTQANIAEIFARLITSNGPATLFSIAEDNELAVVSRDGNDWTATFSISYAPGTLQPTALGDSEGVTTVTLAGTPQPREIWTLTVDDQRFDIFVGETYSLTGGASVVADSLNALVSIFADRVNNLSGFEATISGNALIIIQRSGVTFIPFETKFRYTPSLDSTAYLYDVNQAVGGAASIKLIAAPVTGESWQLTLTESVTGDVLNFDYSAVRNDTLANIAQNLADSINTDATAVTAGYIASVEGDRLVLIKTSTNTFTAGIVTIAADDVTANEGNVQLVADATAPYAWIAELSGSAETDEIWRVSLDTDHDGSVETDFDYTVLDGDTTADIAAALAGLINDASTTFSATADGRTLIIVDSLRTAHAPEYVVQVSAADTTDVTEERFIDSGIYLHSATAAVTLNPTANEGVTYTLLLRSGEIAGQYTYVTGVADTAEQVAQALAASVNVNAPEDFIALIDGGKLYIVNRAGTGFSLANIADAAEAGSSTLVDISGATTLFTGEVWTIILDDGTFTTTHTHVVQAGETHEDLARELSNSIISSGIVTFTATATDSEVVITNLAGSEFTTMVDVTPVGQVSIIETRKFNVPETGNSYFYQPVNLNTRVDEVDQVDTLNLFNRASPADEEILLTSDQITGLGMPDSTVIAGRELAGGIVYRDLEVLNIYLGSGVNTFTIESTHTGATNVYSGSGSDLFYVQGISGHTTINAGSGDDIFRVGSAAVPNLTLPGQLETINALLTLIGGPDNDTLYIDDSAEPDANAGILDGSTLTGLGMPSISEVQTVYVQAAGGVYTLRIADESIDSRTATTTLVELSGTPVHGDEWTIVIDGVYRYTATVDTSGGPVAVETLAGELAGLIDGTNGLTAAADGNFVVIVNTEGQGFQAAFEIVTSATSPVSSMWQIEGATSAAVLTGTVVTGDTWRFMIGDSQYNLLVGASDTLQTLAARLAVAINVDASLVNYVAVTIGSTVVVVDRGTSPGRPVIYHSILLASGDTGSAILPVVLDAESTALVLSGTPVVGDRWIVRVNGLQHIVTVDSTIDTLDEIGLAFVQAIESDFNVNHSAVYDSATKTLLITDRVSATMTVDALVALATPTNGVISLPATGSSIIVNLNGDPQAGETWRVTIDTTDHDYVAGASDTLATITLALANDINNAGGDIVATQVGDTLVLVSRSATDFNASFTLLLASSTGTPTTDVAGSATLTSATSISAALSGETLVGDSWTIDLDGSTSVTVDYNDLVNGITVQTLGEFAAALAYEINIGANGFLAAVLSGETTLVIVEESANFDEPSARVTRAGAGIVTSSDTARILTLSGDPVVNSSWSVNVDGEVISVVAIEGYTAEDLATRFAQAINDNATLNSTHLATTSGEQVMIVRNDGNPLVLTAISISDGAVAGTNVVADAGAANDAWSLELAGTPVAGEVWQVVFDGTTLTLTIEEGMILADVAAGLAALFEAENGYSGFVKDSTLILANNGTAATAPVLSIVTLVNTIEFVDGSSVSNTRSSLAGTVIAGDIWTLTLVSGDSTTNFNYTADAGDDLGKVAIGLVDAVNAAAADGYLAIAEGDDVIVISQSGVSFTIRVDVSLAEAMTVSPDSGSVRTLTLADRVVSGDAWTVALNVDGELYTVQLTAASNIASELASALQQEIDALDVFVATVTGTDIEVSTAGESSGSSFTLTHSVEHSAVAETASVTATGTTRIGTGAGVPVEGERWRIVVDGVDYDHDVAADETLAEVLAALAQAVVDGSGIDAAARDDTLVVIGTASFVMPVRVNGAGTPVAIDGGTFELGGTPSAGDEVTVNPGSETYTHTVRDTVALDELVSYLAARINEAGTDFIARAQDNTLIIENTGLTSPAIDFTISSGSTGSVTKTVTGATTQFDLDGTARIGETWTIAIGASSTIYTVESAEIIAALLAAEIMDPENDSDFIATSEGTLIVVIPETGSFTGTADVSPRNALRAADAVNAMITPVATPVEGEVWEVTIGTVTYSTVVETVGDDNHLQTITELVSAFTDLINADIANGYTAIADGNTLVVMREGSVALAPLTFDVNPVASIELDASTPTEVKVSLAGTLVDTETWYLVIATENNVFSYSHEVISGHTFDDIYSTLLLAINSDTTAGFVAMFDGSMLYLVDAAGRDFSVSLDIGRVDGKRVGSGTVIEPDTTRHDLSGTPDVTEVWGIELTFGDISRAYGYAIVGSETLADIAEAIVAAVNEDLNAGFTAVQDGLGIIVTSRFDVDFTSQGVIAPKIRPAGTIDLLANTQADGSERVTNLIVDFAGTPVSGAVWILELKAGNLTYSFEYAFLADLSLAAVTTDFVAQINAAANTADSSLVGLAALVDANGKLVLIDLSGRSLSTDVTLKTVAEAAIDGGSATTTLLDLSGNPVAGENWTLRIDDLAFDVAVSSTPETLEQIATLLVGLVNNSVDAARYTAIADGTRIIIVDREGAIFDTRLDSGSITRTEGYADIVLDYALTAEQMQERLQALYGFDDLLVTASRDSGNVTYTITFVLNEAGKDFQQIRWTEDAQTTGLVPSPEASVDVVTETMVDGTTVNDDINNLQTVTINPNVTGGTFTLWFRIENARGEFTLYETDPIAYNATALDVYKAISPILNPDGSTIDIDPVYDFENRDPSKPYTDNFAVQKVGNVFIVTFQGAYRNLSIYDIDTRNLVTQETGSTDEHEARETQVTLGSTDGFMQTDVDVPRAMTIDFDNLSIVSGETWNIRLTLRGISTEHSYLVAGGEDLATIAGELADSINTTAADVFAATVDDNTLVIINSDGSDFRIDMTAGATTVGVAAIDRSTPTESGVVLSGSAAVGEVWKITLSDGATTPTTHEYTVLADDTLADIAAGLAAAINSGANVDFAAVADGNELLIVRRDGTIFSATPQIDAAGNPQEGENWAVSLISNASGTLNFSHVVAEDETHASVARALAELINTQGLPEYTAWVEGMVLHIRDVAGNVFTTTFSVDGIDRPDNVEASAATIETRVDGINYYEIENLAIELGDGDDVLNIQETTAATSIELGDGDDRIYISSDASVGLEDEVSFLTGHLLDINGALDIDAGEGANQLMISNEASTLDNDDIVITDNILAGTEPADAEIAIRGLTGGEDAYGWVDLDQATITYGADPDGSFADGVSIWTGFGEDTITIDGTSYRDDLRNFTTLNTGLGDDTVTVDLQAGEDGLFVLNTQGPWNDYPDISDNDTVLAGSSTLPLVIFGGQGNDDITGGSSDDIIFGDRGQVLSHEDQNIYGVPTSTVIEAHGSGGPDDMSDGVIRFFDQVISVDADVGGNDTIDAGEGNNTVVGGFGNDTITTGSGEDVVVGDNGAATYTPGTELLEQLTTTDTTNLTGGNDTIAVGEGDNTVLAGVGTDTVTAGTGSDLVIGDNGQVDWTAEGELSQIQSTDPALGDADNINIVSGDNVVIGGFGGDSITTDLGNDVIVGDNGSLTYDLDVNGNAVLTAAQTTDTTSATGGADTIVSGDGDKVILAGMGGDTVTAGTGDNVVFGDNGNVNWDTTGLITNFESTEVDLGDDDQITLGDGNNTVVGGFGNDTVTTGSGEDVVVGDNGAATYTAGTELLEQVTTTDTTNLTGGNDTIAVGEGDNFVLAGVGNDAVISGSGEDVVLGDNGTVIFDPSGDLTFVTSTDPLLGGSDSISTGDGNDLMIGGAMGDILLSDGGNDIVFGDFGSADYSQGGTVINLSSIDLAYGGNDTLDAGAGNDILIGGQGDDLLFGSLTEDLLFGSYASMTLTNWLVSNIFADPDDFISTIMLSQFDNTYIEGEDDDETEDLLIDLYSALAEVLDEMSAIWHLDDLLDPDVFARVFQLGNYELVYGQNDSGEFDGLTLSGLASNIQGDLNHRMDYDEGIISDPEWASRDGGSLPGQYLLASHEYDINADLNKSDSSEAMLLGLGIMGLQATGRQCRRPPQSTRLYSD